MHRNPIRQQRGSTHIMETAGPQVIDLASFISSGESKRKKTLTPTVEKDHNWATNGVCCFAGASDELVVAASRERDLHVWSVPEGRFDYSTIHRQLVVRILSTHRLLSNCPKFQQKIKGEFPLFVHQSLK